MKDVFHLLIETRLSRRINLLPRIKQIEAEIEYEEDNATQDKCIDEIG